MERREEQTGSHCFRVSKVYDWVQRTTLIKRRETIRLDEKRVSDAIHCDFSVPCGTNERTMLWTSFGVTHIGGSVRIHYENGCGEAMTIFINGKKEASLLHGGSFSGTFPHLHSVEAVCGGCTNENTACTGQFSIHYHFDMDGVSKCQSFDEIGNVTCFLSDQDGRPVSLFHRHHISCSELTKPEERTAITTLTPKGIPVTLQRVDTLLKGFVTVQFFTKKGRLCLQSVFPFSEVETLLVCAPDGTTVDCEIAMTDCKAHLLPLHNDPACAEIAIILLLCEEITSHADVNIEMEGKPCKSRDESLETLLCDPSPPEQCPVFP